MFTAHLWYWLKCMEMFGEFRTMMKDQDSVLHWQKYCDYWLLTGLDRETAIIDLHEKTKQLSVQQRCAFFSIVQVYKTLNEKLPVYHLGRFDSRNIHRVTRSKQNLDVDYRLSISRCSFFYRGAKLYSLLPSEITMLDKVAKFKKAVKAWTMKNIPLLPP